MGRLQRLLFRLRGWVIAPRFHRLFYEAGDAHNGTWRTSTWMGVPALKSPFDMWVYQEILHEKRPDLLIETGTAYGGSALFLAHVMDQLDHGAVISIDIAAQATPAHPRITYLHGSSTDPTVVEAVRQQARGKQVMVILDSDHRAAHVRAELAVYADLVSCRQYLIVEDTNVNGHPVYARFGPGPWEALRAFRRRDRRFVVDRSREKFLFSFNPRGFLLKVKA